MGTKERKEREKEQRREYILQISEKLFLSKGIDATTMDEIASECELSKGTLYIYFKSKEEIYSTIILGALTTLNEMFKEAVSEADDPGKKIRKMGETSMAYYEKYPENYKLMIRLQDHQMFLNTDIKDITYKIITLMDDIFSIMHNIIEEGKKAGIFKENTDPVEVSLSLWSVSTMFLGMIDHMNSHDHSAIGKRFSSFRNLDLKSLLMKNGKRIIYSILTNPPRDFDDM